MAMTAVVDVIPPDATLTAIVHDKGSQRDPEPFLAGMHARWTL